MDIGFWFNVVNSAKGFTPYSIIEGM